VPTQPEFDRYAANYEAMIGDPLRQKFARDSLFFHRRKLELLLDELRRRGLDPSTQEWLDLGCGKGDLIRMGQAHFRRAYGCDVSPQLLNQAAGVEVRLQDGPAGIPFSNESLDVVSAACVYHHIAPKDRLALTRSVHRALRGGGLFCIFEHNPLNPVTRRIVNRCPVDGNAILLRAGESRRLLVEAGFAAGRVKYYLFLPEILYGAAGAGERWIWWLPLGGQYAAIGRKPPR